MRDYLRKNDIEAKKVRFIPDGSLKACWYVANKDLEWTEELRKKINALGLRDFQGKKFEKWSSNGNRMNLLVICNIDFGQPLFIRERIISKTNKRIISHLEYSRKPFENTSTIK